MNADGSNQRNLTNNPAFDSVGRWSPDGRKIAFTSIRDGNAEIYVMDSDGKNPQRLTNNPAIDEASVWSPDGGKIAFQSKRDGNYEVYVMDADGNNPQRLTNNFANEPNDWFDPSFARLVPSTVSPADKQATVWGWLKHKM
jgi:TolB protein